MEPIQEQDLRRVVETYSHMLLRVAMTRVPTTTDAEDVVQDVFLRLMTHSPVSGTGSMRRPGSSAPP